MNKRAARTKTRKGEMRVWIVLDGKGVPIGNRLDAGLEVYSTRKKARYNRLIFNTEKVREGMLIWR